MAALMRSQKICMLQRCILSQLHKNSRAISTSKKNSDTVVGTCEAAATEGKKENKNWVSYGFDYTSQEEDTNVHNATFFFSVTLCLVFGGFAWAYAPDSLLRDWASREGFLELRRRELAGLPLINREYVDPSTIVLPSEEEIGDQEIII